MQATSEILRLPPGRMSTPSQQSSVFSPTSKVSPLTRPPLLLCSSSAHTRLLPSATPPFAISSRRKNGRDTTTSSTFSSGTRTDPVVLLLLLSMSSSFFLFGCGELIVFCRGIGYVQELVSRLTKTTISNFDTSVNSTIVTNPTIFPLDQPIFVDASHDTIMTASQFLITLTSALF